MNNRTRRIRKKNLQLVQLALLAALTVLLALTPIGYLNVGPLSITFLSLPVVIGAIVLGPTSGAILGAVFGITSFAQCFGMNPFGTALAQINVVYTFIMCFVPRILIGVFAGLLAKALKDVKMADYFKYGISSLVGALTNTVLFVGIMIVLFNGSEPLEMLGKNVWTIIKTLVLFNGLVEAVVITVLGAAVTKAIMVANQKLAQSR